MTRHPKEIDPTSTYIRIAKKIGYDKLTNELFLLSTSDLQKKFENVRDETDDDKFEFYEQHNDFNKYVNEGYDLVILKVHPVMADDIAVPPGRDTIQCGAARSNIRLEDSNLNRESPNSMKPAITFTFDQLCSRLSPSAQSTLVQENALNELVMARLSNDEIRSFNFSRSDHLIMQNLIIQCRAQDRKQYKKQKEAVKMPPNEITDRLPLESRVTLRALKKHDLLCPVKLYLTTSYSTIQQFFNQYPSIPPSDQQHIYTGMACARYAQKYGQQ